MGLDIGPNLLKMAQKNARDYGLCQRLEYVTGNAATLPFDDESFDGVFSNGSLHEWEEPERIFNEIYRVLKPGCRFYVSDLKRDMSFIIKWLMERMVHPQEMLASLISSINAAYTWRLTGY